MFILAGSIKPVFPICSETTALITSSDVMRHYEIKHVSVEQGGKVSEKKHLKNPPNNIVMCLNDPKCFVRIMS